MREELKDYIVGLKLKNFKVSTELPFSNSGTAMYLKNPKTIYIDNEQVTNEPFVQTMSGIEIVSEVTTVRVYFSTDAKQQPSDYATVVSSIRNWKYLEDNQHYFRREVDTSTEFENDLTVTQLEFRFTKLS